MNHEVCTERFLCTCNLCVNNEPAVSFLNGLHLRLKMDRRTQMLSLLKELLNQVGIKPFQQALATMEDGHLSVGTQRDMGKLHRNVSTADEHKPLGQRVQVQESVAG